MPAWLARLRDRFFADAETVRDIFADEMAGWHSTSAQLQSGALPDFTAMVSADHAARPFNAVGARVALGMMQAVVTRRNKRQGWRPDGTEITA